MNKEKEIGWNDVSTDEFGELLLYHKWTDFCENGGLDEADKEIVNHFVRLNNIPADSPLAIMFNGFVAGFNKGLETAEQIKECEKGGGDNEQAG